MLLEMYRQWPFFQATIDNAATALAKADMYVGQCYSELCTSEVASTKKKAGQAQRMNMNFKTSGAAAIVCSGCRSGDAYDGLIAMCSNGEG